MEPIDVQYLGDSQSRPFIPSSHDTGLLPKFVVALICHYSKNASAGDVSGADDQQLR